MTSSLGLPSLSAIAVAGSVLAAGFLAAPPAPTRADTAPDRHPLPQQASATTTASAAPPAPAAAHEKQRYVVAAIGDSLTDERSHGGKYLAYLQKKCPESRFDNYGVGGNMVNQMRRRFARDVLGEPRDPANPRPTYTHLIVFGGVNDLCSNLTANRTNPRIEHDLTWLYDQAHAHGMQVVAITVTPWGGFKKFYNAERAENTLDLDRWIKKQGKNAKVEHVLDAYPLLSCGDPAKLCDKYAKPFKDGIHFGPKGHEVLGRALYKQVFSDCR